MFFTKFEQTVPHQMSLKTTQLRRQRDSDLFDAYVAALDNYGFDHQVDAIDFIRQNKAPKFYISAQFCAIVMGRMVYGRPSGIKGKYQNQKFNELFRRFKQMPKMDDESILSKCEILVEQEAPQFYISLRSAREIIARERKNRVNEMVRKWVR